ncbi:MAG: hypothetical protein ACFFDW_07285 [Candidatus Thorarchaeota archaeon]
MAAQKIFLSLKNQLFICLGFLVLTCGLLFNFFSETYPMFLEFKYLFITVDCLGGIIIFLSLFFAFYLPKEHMKGKELWRPLVIESSLTFSFNLSIQALTFHYLFHNSLLPVGLGIFFIFLSYCSLFISLPVSFTLSLFKKYYRIFFTAIGFVSISTLISGVFLTFTGSIEQITSEGIGVFSLGIVSIVAVFIVLIFYPKWKSLLSKEEEEEENENGEIEETDREQSNE